MTKQRQLVDTRSTLNIRLRHNPVNPSTPYLCWGMA